MSIKKDGNMEQNILEAAEKLFLEKGFAMTSTTHIARVAGCNQALVHYYFRTKERLFEAIFIKKAEMFFPSITQYWKEGVPFEENIKLIIESVFDLFLENPQLPFFIFNELTTNPQRAVSLKEKIGDIPGEILHSLQKQLQEEIEKKTIRPISLIDLIVSIVSLNVGLFLASPFLKVIAGISDMEIKNLFGHRKKENVTLILKGLRP
ncbi:MAG: TetR/AcrR family transcriptional regulator [Brevinematales bacterium]|jgi:AcrR family transcriptional regulator